MKASIHPEWMKTKVKCNGCGTSFESESTVPDITVEICSNCHPFYTGKQKLIDTAGRVDKFKARVAAAQQKSKVEAQKPALNGAEGSKAELPQNEMTKIEEELEDKTVDLPAEATPEISTEA